MDPSAQDLLNAIHTVKWLLVALVGVFGAIFAVLVYMALQTRRYANQQIGTREFYDEAKDLLDQGMPDEVAERAMARIKTHPKDKYAHWYLAIAHRDMQNYTKALEVFTTLKSFAPMWGDVYIDPHIADIKRRLQNIRPEVVPD